jgi:hypothetical protein
MKRFDSAPFALPKALARELKFEALRDIESVEVDFAGPAPREAKLQYQRKYWPGTRIESTIALDQEGPMAVGWTHMDDLFTPEWADARRC